MATATTATAIPLSFDKRHEPQIYNATIDAAIATKATEAHNSYKPKDVLTKFNYYKDPEDGGPPPPNYVGKPETFDRPSDTVEAVVHDIRGQEGNFSLDKTGFQIFKHVSQEKDFLDDEKIKSEYYPEVENILKTATGASSVFIFDHTIRRDPSQAATKPLSTNNPSDETNKPASSSPSLRGPVQRVHIDQSYAAGPQRVRHHLPTTADTLLAGRYQIINVWRPIKLIRKDPLGVVDATSVPDTDLVPVQLIYPDRVGETCAVRSNPDHRWYFLREQTPGEVLLIKCFDSKTDGRATRVPHSAFVNGEFEGVGEEPRESIEVRCLVFHPDDRD